MIDKKALIEDLKSLRTYEHEVFRNGYCEDITCFEDADVISVIKQQPTIQPQGIAYDVEEVIKKLKEEAAYEHCPETGEDYLVIDLDDAINIVRVGEQHD